jgi:uncharacterized OB-fold protein
VSDDTADQSTGETAAPQLLAGRCENGHLAAPPRETCPECGVDCTGTVDLSDREGAVRTWTRSTVTPRGVREPNTLAIVAFTVGGESVRLLGQTTGAVAVGDRVRPVPVDQLRDPDAGIRVAQSQRWAGFRFEPV